MAEHYRSGGLPPWSTATVGVGDDSVKAQVLPNNAPTQGSYPKAQYEDPTPFGVYRNLPAVPYSNATGVTSDYSATIPPTPITPSLSPEPQHSQYSGSGATASFEPYNSTPSVRHSIAYARSLATPTQTILPLSPKSSAMAYATQTRPLSSATYGAPSFYGGAQANPVTYNSPPPRPENAEAPGSARGPAYYGGADRGPGHVEASGFARALAYSGGPYSANDSPPKGPDYVEASGSAQAPPYSGGPYSANNAKGPEYVEASGSVQAPAYSGGPYSANEYPKGKDQEYAVPPAGNPTKQ
jgi:hypothetical protein